jgi:large subunit ribosomal protein L24
MHVKKDDLVVVIAGDDADPKRARKVLRVVTKTNKVVVEGVNRVYKHVRARADRRNPQGGRLSKEMPISVSNVLLFCPKCGVGRRTRKKPNATGQKERICVKCESSLGVIGARKKKKAAPATTAQGS